MDIKLFELEDMKTGRSGKKESGERYSKYSDALSPHIKWLKEQIAVSKDGHVRIKTGDIAKEINMSNKASSTIYWGTMYALFKEGIKVEGRGTTNDGDEALIMRFKKDGDTLPPSLQKALNDEQGVV